MSLIGESILFAILGIIIALLIYIGVSWLVMWLINIILAQYGIELLALTSAMAIVAITAILGGIFGATNKR